MAPNVYQKSLTDRGFTRKSDGSWHGPFGIVVPKTWNDITTTSLADSARQEVIRLVDQQLQVKRTNYNAK